jgi:hypothetical protein
VIEDSDNSKKTGKQAGSRSERATSTACTDHGAAEGCVLGQHAGPPGLCPTACAPVGLQALRPVHGPDTLVAPDAATLGHAPLGHYLFLLRVYLLIPGQTLGCGRGTQGKIS